MHCSMVSVTVAVIMTFDSSQLLELGALGAYLIVLMWIGIRSARQVRTSADYTLAGRNVPWIIVLATTAVTLVGGGASVGMVSRVYQVGIAAAVVSCAWHLQILFTGLWVAPKLRGLNLITVADYFQLKFGKLARILAVVNCLIFLVGGLTAQMVAMGAITNSVLGVSYQTALLIGATVTIFYSTVGGIRAVVKTDVLQFAILVCGIAAAAAILLVKNGGFVAMVSQIDPRHFELTGHWSTTRVVSLFCVFLLGETFVPTYTVRCFIAKDSQHSRWGIAGAGIFLLLFLPIATLVLGLSVLVDPAISQAVRDQPQSAFPILVRTTFHPALAGIMIAALVAAVMSSADSFLSCLATVFMEDIYRRHVRPDANDRALLRVAKWSTLLAGMAAAVCAYFFRDIVDVLEFVYNFWAPAMILPFLVGIFWYTPARVHAVVASMVAGMGATVVWQFVLGTPGELSPALFGLLAAVVVFVIVLPLTRRLRLGPLFKPDDALASPDGETP